MLGMSLAPYPVPERDVLDWPVGQVTTFEDDIGRSGIDDPAEAIHSHDSRMSDFRGIDDALPVRPAQVQTGLIGGASRVA
jgi:hypothetical protein